eukprot:TRINITY_DN14331_c0_g1_i1.p1 TRINITY_DN14331_c0_g1~~TRINITY_DN14331_c0_g1_i1.p1  ORF type:complete len:165 (-),score=23.55 TRINITY_DN14331_c0_g1_i1:557-1051(-)
MELAACRISATLCSLGRQNSELAELVRVVTVLRNDQKVCNLGPIRATFGRMPWTEERQEFIVPRRASMNCLMQQWARRWSKEQSIMDALLNDIVFASCGQDLKPDDTPESLGWPAKDVSIVIDVLAAGTQLDTSIANTPCRSAFPSYRLEHGPFPWGGMALASE